MVWQLGRLDLDEIGFDVLDDAVADAGGEKIDNRRMNFGRRGERPAFAAVFAHDPRNLIGKLFVNAAVSFVFELGALSD